MQATAILRQEHELIEQALDLLDCHLQRHASGQSLDWPFARWLIDFIVNFADGSHHAKEETVLFPILERRGVPRQGGPIGCMLHEHEIGRLCVARMRRAQGNQADDEFVQAAREYADLLRQHIFKENNVLFRMADACLSPEDAQQIAQGYQIGDAKEGRQNLAEEYARQLAHWEREKQGPPIATP